MEQIPLTHEASAGDTHKQSTSTLPPEVVQCLENARFVRPPRPSSLGLQHRVHQTMPRCHGIDRQNLADPPVPQLHLATCTDNQPHVSLMNYTYLPSSPFSSAPVIVMTTNPASKKMNNLVANPNVSLLVHDCVSLPLSPSPRLTPCSPACRASSLPLSANTVAGVSHRPPTTARRLSGPNSSSPAPDASGHRPSLAALLLTLNTSAVSSISATINGSATLLPSGSPEEAYYRRQHLENNTFESEGGGADLLPTISNGGAAGGEGPEGGIGGGRFVDGEEVRVVVVGIRDVRISDWKGQVRDWVLVHESGQPEGLNGVAGPS